MSYSGFKLLFGDIHAHSNYSLCGICDGRLLKDRDCYIHTSVINSYMIERDPEVSVDLFYERAREKMNLDFAALTDHDFSMSDEVWRILKEKASKWYSPGRFTTLNAYEWTSYAYGHRNVYFLDDDPPLIRCVSYGVSPSAEVGISPAELWSLLDEAGVKAITIPHHPSITQFPIDWNYFNSKYDRLLEIVSIWGVFEYYGNPFYCMESDNMPRFFAVDALERGYKMGFIGGGDSHDCYPASKFRPVIISNMGTKMFMNSLSTGYMRYFHNSLGAGFAGLYATENSREGVFEALNSRRAYAVVGAKIRLEFILMDHLMGEELTLEDPREPIEVYAKAEGEERIDTLEIIKNGRVIHRVYGSSSKISTRFIDDEKPKRLYNYYYVRVTQRDGSRAWSSPIWVSYRGLGKIEPIIKGSLLTVRNRCRFRVGDIKLSFLKDNPFIETSRTDLNIRKRGVFVWTERANSPYDLVLRVRFKSSNRKANFRGSIKLQGIEEYKVEPVNFAKWKYGGDLFRDDYLGFIEWDITPSSNLNGIDIHDVKGLNVWLRLNPMRDAYAIMDVFIDGSRPLGNTFLGSKLVKDIPFKVFLCRTLGSKVVSVGGLEAGEDRTIIIPKGEWRFLALHPALMDELGLRWLMRRIKVKEDGDWILGEGNLT